MCITELRIHAVAGVFLPRHWNNYHSQLISRWFWEPLVHAIHIYQGSSQPGCVSNLINRSLYQTSILSSVKVIYFQDNICNYYWIFYWRIFLSCQRAAYYTFLLHDDITPLITSIYISSCGNLQTKTVIHTVNCTVADVSLISQTKLIGTLPNTGWRVQLHQQQTAVEKRKREPNKNRWVSAERNDGTAMGAVCDWSIPSPSKPFFSRRHVQSVDKRHHPTDSLINCEMYSYLPLSYSRAPKTPPLPASSSSPLLTSL